MYQKVKLDDKSNFELSYVTNQLAHMVVAYDEGSPGFLSIGREQGELGWDDIRIQTMGNSTKLFQAKYQQTDFSQSPAIRGVKQKGKNKGDKMELSPLDEAMKALSGIYPKGNIPLSNRTFTLLIPVSEFKIKKDLEMRSFIDFLRSCREPSAASEEFEERAKTDKPTSRIFSWLTTWCDFEDWDHVLKTMKFFDVEVTGLIGALEHRSEEILARRFIDGKEARLALTEFVRANSSDVAVIKPRQALKHLYEKRLETKSSWTLFIGPANGCPEWHVAGTASLASTGVESPEEIVASAWRSPGGSIILALAVWPQLGTGTCELLESIGRIALHADTPTVFHNLAQWKERLSSAVGGTLGLDADTFSQAWTEAKKSRDCLDKRTLATASHQRQEAVELHEQMNRQFLKMVDTELGSCIALIKDSKFLDKLTDKWCEWRQKLETDPVQLENTLKSFLRPRAERDLNGLLRAGPRTKHLVKDTLYILLALAVCCEDCIATWSSIDRRTISSISLRYWSGPGNSPLEVRRLDEDAVALVRAEHVDLVVLSGVEASPVELRSDSMAAEDERSSSMAETPFPAMVTNNSIWRKNIKAGNQEWLRQQVQAEFSRRRGDSEDRIHKLVEG